MQHLVESQMVCQHIYHGNSEIIGICKDQKCKKTPFVCFYCMKQYHSHHIEKLLYSKEISKHLNKFKILLEEIRNNYEICFKEIENIINCVIKSKPQLKPNMDINHMNSQQNIIRDICNKIKIQIFQIEDYQYSFQKLRNNFNGIKSFCNMIENYKEFRRLRKKSFFLKEKFKGVYDSIERFSDDIVQSLKDYQTLIQHIQLDSVILTSFDFTKMYSLRRIEIPIQKIMKCENQIQKKLKQMEREFSQADMNIAADVIKFVNKNNICNVKMILIFITSNMQLYYLLNNSEEQGIYGIFKFKDSNFKHKRLSKNKAYKNKTYKNRIQKKTLKINYDGQNSLRFQDKNKTIKQNQPHIFFKNEQQEQFLMIGFLDKQISSNYQESNYVQIYDESNDFMHNQYEEISFIDRQLTKQLQNQLNQHLQEQNDNQIYLYYGEHFRIETLKIGSIEVETCLYLQYEQQINIVQVEENIYDLYNDYNLLLELIENNNNLDQQEYNCIQIQNQNDYNNSDNENDEIMEENNNNLQYEEHIIIENLIIGLIEVQNNLYLQYEQQINIEQVEENYYDLYNEDNLLIELIENNDNLDQQEYNNIQLYNLINNNNSDNGNIEIMEENNNDQHNVDHGNHEIPNLNIHYQIN